MITICSDNQSTISLTHDDYNDRQSNYELIFYFVMILWQTTIMVTVNNGWKPVDIDAAVNRLLQSQKAGSLLLFGYFNKETRHG